MAWDHLSLDDAHKAYAIIGIFTTVFSLVSLLVKEKAYIGEATVATIVGLIVGPHCLKWFVPNEWLGNHDYLTLELSRIVLIVQIFAVAVELPKKYMLRHWFSVFLLLVPVMAFGWLLTSVFIWKLFPILSWLESLVVAGCVTATDPVLASAVVGKGKFAQRVPGHLRNLLSAESGCNDGMAFPFTYLGLYLIENRGHAGEIVKNFLGITVFYECVFGCVLGAVIGYVGRHSIKYAESHDFIDRESFLVFYFLLSLICGGVGAMIGTDDLLVAFSAGTAFAWDGWFTRKTEESHVSNVIDLLLNMTYFVYLGAIIPWEYYNRGDLGLHIWRYIVLAILVLLFRRIPAIFAIKPIIPDIKTWREALFCGHFGPIGVGAIFMSILARAELEHGHSTPLKDLPEEGSKNYTVIMAVWPIATFLVISSIVVHGSSIAVFALGKRLNTMAITMSVTTGNQNSSSWMNRLPRIDTIGRSISLHRIDTMDPEKFKSEKKLRKNKNKKKKNLRRTKSEDRHVPVNQSFNLPSAIKSDQQEESEDITETKIFTDGSTDSNDQGMGSSTTLEQKKQQPSNIDIHDSPINLFKEGDDFIVENKDGEVLKQFHQDESGVDIGDTTISRIQSTRSSIKSPRRSSSIVRKPSRRSSTSLKSVRSSDPDFNNVIGSSTPQKSGKGGRQKVTAYQLDDTIILENEEGEVVRRYKINRHHSGPSTQNQNTANTSSTPTTGNRARSGSKLDRALSWVKQPVASMMKSSGTSKPTTDVNHDLESGRRQKTEIVQEYDDTDSPSPRLNDEMIENKLKTMVDSNLHGAVLVSHSDDEGEHIDLRQEQDQVVSSSEGEEEEEDYDEETEVEKRRRMAALGIGHDDDDEEDDDDFQDQRPGYRRKPSAIAEDSDEDENEERRQLQIQQQSSSQSNNNNNNNKNNNNNSLAVPQRPPNVRQSSLTWANDVKPSQRRN